MDFVEFPAHSPADVGEAKRFYGAAFGWSFTDWGQDYADTSDSGLGCGFNADPAHRPAAPLAVIYARNLQAAHDRIVAAGGVITRAAFAFPGGRRFHFRDPAGNELAVWSDEGPGGA